MEDLDFYTVDDKGLNDFKFYLDQVIKKYDEMLEVIEVLKSYKNKSEF